MNRRKFLNFGILAPLAYAQKKPRQEAVSAAATRSATPRVGLITSNYRGSEEHDGTKIPGLSDPRPVDADLTPTQIEVMLFKAMDLGSPIAGGISSIITPDEWVVILAAADSLVVRALTQYLVEHKCGARITIAGLSDNKLAEDFTHRFPDILFDRIDLGHDRTVDLPVPNKPDRSYTIPKTIQQCDRLISVVPLQTDPQTGVSLTIKNYLAITQEGMTSPGNPANLMLDLFAYHPADYAIAGGCWGTEGGTSVHHNVIVAGPNALSVDAVAAGVMGFSPAELPYLSLAERRGFGVADPDVIWIRGDQIEEARRPFRKP